MRNITNQKGQSLFELMVAVMVIGVTLVALTGLVSTSISNNTFSKNRTQAENYTTEAMEWLRAQRDESWGTFLSYSNPPATYCMQTLTLSVKRNCADDEFITDTILVREAELVYISDNSVEVRLRTRWTDSKGTHESRASTKLTNWRTN